MTGTPYKKNYNQPFTVNLQEQNRQTQPPVTTLKYNKVLMDQDSAMQLCYKNYGVAIRPDTDK